MAEEKDILQEEDRVDENVAEKETETEETVSGEEISETAEEEQAGAEEEAVETPLKESMDLERLVAPVKKDARGVRQEWRGEHPLRGKGEGGLQRGDQEERNI